ncbi:hypothetical protein CATYP_06305 [Corynebacterium atypicum]|uniref:THUMP-like domain-containing protein n=1 Tax=Corynebacterium atypicum TaxID=191610 RepID=A0ABM5QN83_9CORY|nr:hypothetical protein [Corynebacterium atypicum]AIG64282.1 hypothetical protein CATYP_06305 [Corynebacterium atypicum]
MSFTYAEVDFLAAHAGEVDELAAQAGLTKKTALADAALFRRHFGEFGRACLELAQARRRMPGWLADSESSQQATHRLVAAERARLFAAAGVTRVVDVTCSVGGEGPAMLHQGLGYFGSDVDLARLKMATLNVPEGSFYAADALAPAVRARDGEVILADPARRSGGRRITRTADLKPPPAELERVYAGRRLAIKCAPGIDYSDWPGLVSVVSVDGGVKEAGLYSPQFGTGRQAVVIRTSGTAPRVDRIDSSYPSEVAVGRCGRFILDPDGAIVRAGLVAHYACREGLWMLDPHIAYLTGARLPAGTSGFEVLDEVPLKRLKAALAARDCGSAEILVRGVDLDPDQLRAKLKLTGRKQLAVVIARVGNSARAFVCSSRVHSLQ